LLVATLSGLAGGCALPPAHPPQTVAELDHHRRSGTQEFPNRTIVLHNVRRVLANDLPPEQRLESLKVVERVDAPEAEAYPALAGGLSDAQTPRPVRLAVLAFLARRDYPALADQVASALPQASDPRMRTALLEWLENHPSPVALADVVKLWAAEKTYSQESETRFRTIVERISGQAWDQALLDGLNASDFAARGSAVEILTLRFKADALQKRILATEAQSDTMRALQYLTDAFDYLPRTRRELLAAVTMYGGGAQRLRLASELAQKWRPEGYQFNIRDCHLLGSLAGDPPRKPIDRQGLCRDISAAVAARRGGPAMGDAGWRQRVFRRGRLVDFDSQMESLSLADLWSLYLINEMLDRPRMREALRIMAERDRADTQTQWGGLVTCDQGQAEAKLYPPAARRGDDQYVPSELMLTDALDALCSLVGHFDQVVENPSWIGPSKQELEFAKDWNISGLVLSSLVGGKIDAMYYNPEGVVVDLGEVPVGPK
jgi:hypothetical protein